MAYIEREALMKYADTQPGGLISNKSIQFFPASEVAPIRRGRWIVRNKGMNNWVDCSECGTIGSPHWKWCPVCGCRMDLSEGDTHDA